MWPRLDLHPFFQSIALYITSSPPQPAFSVQTHTLFYFSILYFLVTIISWGQIYILLSTDIASSMSASLSMHRHVFFLLLFFKYSLAVKLELLNTFDNITHGSMSTFLVQGIVRVRIPSPSQLFDCTHIYLGKVGLLIPRAG